jgi:hypothetical protein
MLLVITDTYFTLFHRKRLREGLSPPDKLFWRARKRNTPAGMKFREDRHAFRPFPVDTQLIWSSLGKGDGKQKI